MPSDRNGDSGTLLPLPGLWPTETTPLIERHKTATILDHFYSFLRKLSLPASLIQSLFSNTFFLMEFFKLIELDNPVIEGVAISMFALGTTGSFISTVSPHVTKERHSPHPRVNQFLSDCLYIFDFEIRLQEEVNQNQEIWFYFNDDQLKEDFKKEITDINELRETLKTLVDETYPNHTLAFITQDELEACNNDLPTQQRIYYWKKQPVNTNLTHVFIDIHSHMEGMLGGWPRAIIFRYLQAILPFMSGVLSVNHVLQHFIGGGEDMPLPRYIPMQVFAIAIALFKLSITWERKFKRGEKWWAEFYLRVKLGKSSICEILKICLTSPHNLLALCTYTASMFFFFEKGAIDQILKITCRISTACEHDFNALNPPPLSGWKLPVAYSLTAMSTITLIFTQIITDIDRYLQNQNAASGFCEKVTRLFQCLCRRDQNRETNPETLLEDLSSDSRQTTQKHFKVWVAVIAANTLEGCQQGLGIFTSMLSFLAHVTQQSPNAVLKTVAAVFAAGASLSYWGWLHRQGKDFLTKTAETVNQIKDYLPLSIFSCPSSHDSHEPIVANEAPVNYAPV
ncbi:Dot/Icm T4SS effector CoxCC11 [Coxiella burnetii]|uniref:Dot/Icm T4SS effector CoxCC11 n=1 Tax=Coxiella burnetii TaxID=777 RepID=UPI000C04F11C|nr:Dot/Icm T4SS effector CoxCC11 [Coxiella burnetii]ATN86485.1 hypothetical protein AYO29_08700 [Coxiella burnetii str. Schperling]